MFNKNDDTQKKILHLRKRKDFLKVAEDGTCVFIGSIGLQLFKRPVETKRVSPSDVRLGFTATKKLGNAVKRNRIKRRLRAAAREVLPRKAPSGYDCVLIGRLSTSERPFFMLKKDLKRALKKAIDTESSAS